MLKKCFAGLLAPVLLLALLPVAALAAGPVEMNVYGFTKDSQEIMVFFKNVEAGDRYVIELVDEKDDTNPQDIVSKTFERDGEDVVKLTKASYPILSDLRRGDALRVTVLDKYKLTTREQIKVSYDTSGVGPTKMELDTRALEAKDSYQNLRLRFDRDYTVASNDRIRLVAYDKDGTRMDRKYSQVFKIGTLYPDGDYYRRTTLSVRPDPKVSYYEVEFLMGQNVLAELTKKLPLDPPASAVSSLVVRYPSDNVKLGQTVKPEVYFLDKKSRRVEARNPIFVFVGNAIDKKDIKTGEFTVKDDKAYVGSDIKITVAASNLNKTVSLKVVAADGSSQPTQKINMIMNIGSKEIIINQSKKTIDAAPFVQNNRTYVPLRAMGEGFGAKVDFDDKTQKITITNGANVVKMTVGQKLYTVNGKEKTMDVAPFIVRANSRTMVPVRFAAEAMGYKVQATTRNGLTASVLFSNY